MVVYSFLSLPHELNFLFFLLVLGGLLLLTSSIGLTISLFMASDSFSYCLMLLTMLVFFFSILSIYYEKLNYSFWAYLNFLLFILVFFLFLLFFSCEMFFFYIFFELTVIPTFIIIIGWGYSVNRLQASFYMLVYMLLSSFPFLFSFLFCNGFGLSFMFFFGFYSSALSIGSFWWFILFVVFSIKLPVFFLHLWLPKAHVDAPLLGSMVLAGVLLKMGGFGLLSVSFLLFPFYYKFGWFLASFSLVGSFYAAIVCLRQTDIKSLVAYSSIVHMGPVFSCFFLLSYYSLLGSFLIMISHGLCSCALFFLLNFISKLFFTRSIFFLRGSILVSAVFTFFWFCYCFFNMGCPPSFNFFSEFISIFSCLLYSQFFLLIFFLIMVTVGFYCVTMMASLSHGRSFFYFPPTFLFLKLSDLLVSLFLSFFLLFFIFFSFIFSC